MTPNADTLVVDHLGILLPLHFARRHFPKADCGALLDANVVWRPARFVVLPQKLRLINSFLKIRLAVDGLVMKATKHRWKTCLPLLMVA